MIAERGWPGKMRQLMLASARWGSAFRAWPPLIMVTTQVVPILPTVAGLAVSAAMAPEGRSGLAAKAFIAAPVCGSSYLAALTK